MPGATNDGGEDSPGGVVSGEPSLAHPGPVVNDQRGNILVTHPGRLVVWCVVRLARAESKLELAEGRDPGPEQSQRSVRMFSSAPACPQYCAKSALLAQLKNRCPNRYE